MKMKSGILAIAIGMIGFAGTAEARTYTVSRTIGPQVAKFCKEYVPATVRVNTRGRLARGARNYWVETPDTYTRMRDPAVYFKTERTVEPDHYTLTRC